MSKKRERSEGGDKASSDVTLGPDPSIAAEALLFELAPNDNANFATTGGDKPATKRSKPNKEGAQSLHETKLEDGAASSASAAARAQHPAAIAPTSSLRLCDGFDVVRKGGRGRGRQLMVMPGALGLGSTGGKLGTLKNVTTPFPVLYVEFPEGRLKCTGRTVYTKGRFFTLYADKTGFKATRMDCRDVFDSIVFFNRACWIGKKEDNPDEEPFPLPASLESLPQDPEKPDVPPPSFKTHFGGGNPAHLLSEKSSQRSAAEKQTLADGEKAATDGAGEVEGSGGAEPEGGESTAVAEPARRSGRARKSTVTYVDNSDNFEESDGDRIVSSSSEGSDNEGSGGGGGSEGKEEGSPENSKQGLEKDGDDDIQEVFSILDAPALAVADKPVDVETSAAATSIEGTFAEKVSTARGKGKPKTPPSKKKPQAASTGRNKSAKPKATPRPAARPSSQASKSSASLENSTDPGDDGGDSGEASPASVEGEDLAPLAEPSRRSRRTSAVARIKYTQSSGSEAEEDDEALLEESD